MKLTRVIVAAIAIVASLQGALQRAVANAAAGDAAQPRHILLLYSFGPHFAPWSTISASIREELRKQSPHPIDLYEASLQGERFGEVQPERPFIDYLRSLFTGRDLGLVVAMGAPAARFVLRNRADLFPATPLLIAATDARAFSDGTLTANDTAVATTFDQALHIDNILQVLPGTTDIVVAIGDSPLERFWTAELRRSFERFASRVTFHWLNELSAEEMVKRVAELPPRHAIYYGTVRVDARGVPQEGDRVLSQFIEVARAPIFTYVDSHFGHGIVGGPLLSTREVANKSAAVAVRILNGETPGNIKTPPLGEGAPVYDWRELRRWHINESTLPPGSIVHFREPTVWEQYRAQMLGAVAVVLGQSSLIGWLLYEHRRRRRSEAAAHKLSGQLITAQEEERSRLGRELHDDVTQRLALLAIEAGREEARSRNDGGGTAMRTVRDGLMRLSEDVHALSYRLHPSILEDLGLREALNSECEHFSQTSSLRVDVSADELPEQVPKDVGLCLFRVAQESLRNIARHASASRAGVRLRRSDGGLQLTVKDNGAGFDPTHHGERASLGLASMRQRVALLGGKLTIDSKALEGTTISAWVPIREGATQPARAAGDDVVPVSGE